MYPTVGLRGRAQRHRLSGLSQVTIERASTGTVTTNVVTNREVERFRERTSQVRTNLLNNISRISAHNLSGNNRDRGELLRFNVQQVQTDRKSTRLNSSHVATSYAVFCSKKKTRDNPIRG